MNFYIAYEYDPFEVGRWCPAWSSFDSLERANLFREGILKYPLSYQNASQVLTEFPEKIGMGTKPDPFKFQIVRTKVVAGNTIVLAKYDGCTTFDGHKIMVLRGVRKTFHSLDPHFLTQHFVIARFEPTSVGWDLALLVAKKYGYIRQANRTGKFLFQESA